MITKRQYKTRAFTLSMDDFGAKSAQFRRLLRCGRPAAVPRETVPREKNMGEIRAA